MSKKQITVGAASLVVAAGLLFSPAANATTPAEQPLSEPVAAAPANPAPVVAPAAVAPAGTGDYEWMCVGIDGSIYSMAPGEPTSNCKGSYLQKYLDGRQLATYNLAYNGNGSLADPEAGSCVLSLAVEGAALVMSPPTGGAAWFAASVTVGWTLAQCAA